MGTQSGGRLDNGNEGDRDQLGGLEITQTRDRLSPPENISIYFNKLNNYKIKGTQEGP